jgi:hypothetical protein
MRQYSLKHHTDGRYGIYVGPTLLATIGTQTQAKTIVHRLAQKQLEQSITPTQPFHTVVKRQRLKVI